ncbi:hypothetical protein [Sphaerisporangium rhizosphaerae]|uniref:Uncharacterized protein n=1 Tax=Sphaerisporangium rhizosphaerae TaxID=2269375 RepID=A0ABW2P2Q5_9ACTN
MGRYQCPLCNGIHRHEDTPHCPVHGMGSARDCADCARVAALVPCGGGR